MALELSLFFDESGSDAMDSKYYLLTIVLHDQSAPLADDIAKYEQSLREKGLADVPFHASPLMNGHDGYEGLDAATRKRMLSTFRVFFRHLPIRYRLIKLRVKEHNTPEKIEAAMRRALVDFIFDELAYFQSFDDMKIYYDNGQHSVAAALRKAVEYALAKDAVEYRIASAQDYRLSQAADYICTMELTALKYADHETTATDEKFFGSWSMFKKGILKEVRAKAFGA